MNGNTATGVDTAGEDKFFLRICRRLMVTMAFLTVALTPIVWFRFQARTGISFLAGALIAILNFYWLALTVRAFGAKAIASSGRSGPAGVVVRSIFRYVLIALAAYVIFRSSESLYGLFAGLSLPVAAILVEAGIEACIALRAGI